MAKLKKSQQAQYLREQLIRVNALHQQRANEIGLDPQHYQLSLWQSQRLSRTYSDLFSESRYRLAMQFFQEELYGPKDFSRRDQDLERIIPVMVKLLPARVLRTVALAMELNALSYELDSQLIIALSERDQTVWQQGITEESYAEAYRRCDNFMQRRRQIDLFYQVGQDLDAVAHKAFLATALKIAGHPARLAGLGELQDFLELGLQAFRRMQGAQTFLDTIEKREIVILERIQANHPRPFQWAD